MRITDVAAFPVWTGDRNQLLVKVSTDEEIVGWGESGLSTRELAVQGALRHLREWLVGRDPMRRGALWQEMYRAPYFEGGRVLTASISAIDIALHDIVGKKLGVPVYELLGGRHRDFVPLFASPEGATTDALLSELEAFTAAGWRTLRLSVSGAPPDAVFDARESIAQTAECVNAVRNRLGQRLTLGLDYHHRLSVAEAASFCAMLEGHALDFLEEPIRDESPSAYESLRRMTSVPFAIGEEFSSKWAFLPYIERDILNFARIDICNVGGFTEAMKVAGLAESHYIDIMPHNPLGPIATAAAAHMAMAVPNFACLEIFVDTAGCPLDVFYSQQVYPVQPEIVAGQLRIPDAPGLGVEVDEAALDEHFHFFEFPHLRRPDGSFTNW